MTVARSLGLRWSRPASSIIRSGDWVFARARPMHLIRPQPRSTRTAPERRLSNAIWRKLRPFAPQLTTHWRIFRSGQTASRSNGGAIEDEYDGDIADRPFDGGLRKAKEFR